MNAAKAAEELRAITDLIDDPHALAIIEHIAAWLDTNDEPT